MKKNTAWFSLIFALVVMIIASTMSVYLLNFTIPYARNVKGLENSSKAYYLWSSWVEQALWYIGQNNLWDENTITASTSNDYGYDIVANGDLVPEPGQWNSTFDEDWNLTWYGEPIQLAIGDDMISNWGNVDFYFRVPDLDDDGNNTDQSIIWDSSTIVLTWQLSSSSDTLLPNGTGAFITSSDVNNSTSFSLSSQFGEDLDYNITSFSAFYTANCWVGQPCVLKISPVDNMFLNDVNQTVIPYLEYQIDTGGQIIPTRFTNINAEGLSYGFRKNINIKVPQLTTDQAFDFTVFQ